MVDLNAEWDDLCRETLARDRRIDDCEAGVPICPVFLAAARGDISMDEYDRHFRRKLAEFLAKDLYS